MKGIGYIRVSTDGQEKGGTSLGHQEDCIRDYCRSRSIELLDVISDTASGKDFNRRGFKQLQERLHADSDCCVEKRVRADFDCVIVFKYDRLSRSPVDGRIFTDQLEERGKSLIAVDGGVDTSTAQGRMFFTLMLTWAEMEREIIKERFAAGRESRLKQGRKPSSYNYGFQRNSQKDLEPIEEEINIVKQIFNLYKRHESIAKVVDVLNNELRVKTRRGGIWASASVRNILVNAIYVSKIVWKGELILGTHSPVVSTKAFNQVRRVLTANRKSRLKR